MAPCDAKETDAQRCTVPGLEAQNQTQPQGDSTVKGSLLNEGHEDTGQSYARVMDSDAKWEEPKLDTLRRKKIKSKSMSKK